MSCVNLGSGRGIAALAVLAPLLVSPLTLGGPVSWLKVENPQRYIQIGAHLLVPPDGLTHPITPGGIYWASPYTWAGAPAAGVTGSAQHLIALCPGEAAPGPFHPYALTVTPGIPAPRAWAYARLLHPGPWLHPDLFIELLAASPNAAVFASIAVHDPPPDLCPTFRPAPNAQEVVPPTDSEAVSAGVVTVHTPDGSFDLGLVVHGISQEELISSAIHVGPEGTNGPPIFDLGPGYEWTDLDGIAIGRVVEEAPFPLEYIEALLHGDTYINLCTMEYPEGEIRGQIIPMPWTDDFDYYPTGSDLHGQSGWKGWDNDPAGTAYVTDAQSLSPPNSVDIAGNSDLVHEFDGYDSGKWAFTAWSYVPSDFESGGTEPFRGSFFIMLNTYADGGPHEESDWSVQMNFDSNDGMLKVYYGNGMNTVDVPYVPDEWVELQVVIDLDADLTQVYYDEACVVEYSWTGGVMGGGGGALNIAALDLFANQSTSVFWDDLSLVPYVAECPGDLDGDRDVDLADLAQLLAHYGMTSGAEYQDGDLDGDGDVDLSDLAALLAVYGTTCP